MDLRLLLAAPTDAERAAVDTFLDGTTASHNGRAPAGTVGGRAMHGGHEARDQRHLLLPILEHVQARMGWISEGALGYICERLTVPPADAYGVATFYALLSMDPRPARVLHVCDDVVCRCQGAEQLIAGLEERIGPEDVDCGGCTWLRSPCLGQCDRAPAAMLTLAGEHPTEHALAAVTVEDAIGALKAETVPAPSPAGRAPAGRSRAYSCCAVSASSTRGACTTTAPAAGTRRSGGRSRSARGT